MLAVLLITVLSNKVFKALIRSELNLLDCVCGLELSNPNILDGKVRWFKNIVSRKESISSSGIFIL